MLTNRMVLLYPLGNSFYWKPASFRKVSKWACHTAADARHFKKGRQLRSKLATSGQLVPWARLHGDLAGQVHLGFLRHHHGRRTACLNLAERYNGHINLKPDNEQKKPKSDPKCTRNFKTDHGLLVFLFISSRNGKPRLPQHTGKLIAGNFVVSRVVESPKSAMGRGGRLWVERVRFEHVCLARVQAWDLVAEASRHSFLASFGLPLDALKTVGWL